MGFLSFEKEVLSNPAWSSSSNLQGIHCFLSCKVIQCFFFQVLTPLLAHPDPLLAGLCHHINPTPGTSLGFRSAFSAVCSLPCHRDAAMQPLHSALSPKRNIAHHTEILHNAFKSIKCSLLTPLHNLMPSITWKRKFYLRCNYAILCPPFHQTLPFLIHFHSLVSVPQGMVCSTSK